MHRNLKNNRGKFRAKMLNHSEQLQFLSWWLLLTHPEYMPVYWNRSTNLCTCVAEVSALCVVAVTGSIFSYRNDLVLSQISTSLVFNILAACAAGVQFSLGIVAATNDRYGDDRLSDSTLHRISRYDIYYSKLPGDWFPCGGPYGWVSLEEVLISVSLLYKNASCS